ncbi:PAS domain-containing protein [Oculatella sp. LEGE 06141]|uniref:CheR family methyltransferase n=1 Tax=Oculatella sp. LEGE 06141 TaxID=1828648 RepID=UPI00187E0A6B|nr:CheR family methyltransferase [Oculatella sp. LEGE 06141]MBE9180861.1 PAS domain-containing protein [Oculatella sp. LEGE 06141]
MTITTNNDDDRVFEILLDYLRRVRGFDFTGYKRASLRRRVQKQMQTVEVQSFGDYLDYLEVHPEEFTALFNTILINVTAFFRDMAAWQYLQHQTLPLLLQQKPPTEPIRVWSVGCASGEEAYTIAMLLADELGADSFRQRVKIYATDADEEALTQARQASYTAKDIEPVPIDMREKYFEPVGDRYTFRSDLRRAVIFGRHDIVQNAPISRLDLLVCRNTLMYFNTETQSRILARFHFALNESSALFLGKAEMLLTHTHLFAPLSLQHRIFTKVPNANIRDRLMVLAQAGDEEASGRLSNDVRLREAAFNAVPTAQVVVDFNGTLVMANMQARILFRISLLDIGQPLQDVEISYRPLELRSRIEQVYNTRQPVTVNDVFRDVPDGGGQYFDVQFMPLQENGSDLLGVSITFADVTQYHDLQLELQRSNQELETSNEELQSANEELETTNEELQSTNEELETTNEELQSTNEELETMNEELQSTNEELQTINDELRLRTDDLNQSNAFLNSILTNLRTGAVVVDRQLRILTWNDEAANMWGLRSAEVRGQTLLGLDIGLPVEQLAEPIRQSLLAEDSARQEVTVTAMNRRGRTSRYDISISVLLSPNQERLGVILLMEESDL